MAVASLIYLFDNLTVLAQSKAIEKKGEGAGTSIYVYREKTIIGIANIMDVPFLHIDGRLLERIKMGGYIPIALSPGQHKLTTTESFFTNDTGKVRGQATVTVPAGTTIYLRYSETFKSISPIVLPSGVYVNSTGNYHFELVAEPTAKREMKGIGHMVINAESRNEVILHGHSAADLVRFVKAARRSL